MNEWAWMNVGLALLWIAVWIAALIYNWRLLAIYRADRAAVAGGDPILIIQARGRVHRLSGRVLASGAFIGLGGITLWSRLAGSGVPLTWASGTFSVVAIVGALGALAQCHEEVRDRAEMERLAAVLSSDN